MTEPRELRTTVIDVQGCARCENPAGHPQLTFTELRRPLVIGGVALDYWAACPETGEPILMLMLPDDETARQSAREWLAEHGHHGPREVDSPRREEPNGT